LDGCPNQYVDQEAFKIIGLADMYEKGIPPVSGGSLDQSNWFVEFCRWLWSENSRIEKELTAKK
jgi:hypothetical protein